ncbi:hypothetical protein PEM37_38635 [Streptomyces sp. AD681]|nr:hypothetical protein [Streptomyces sp. AD681]MDA5147428.1 hypothetical protein [Streptomyces sp. AD681]
MSGALLLRRCVIVGRLRSVAEPAHLPFQQFKGLTGRWEDRCW